MRPWSVLLLNFIVQYVVVYLLMQKTNGESREAALQLFRQSSDTEEEGMCLKLDAQDFPYLPSFSGLSCTPDEVMMLLDFDKIDSDGNGRWTYQEAKDLNKQYTKDMKRYLDLSQVYLSIFEKFRQNAGSQPMTPCGLGEHVEVDVSLDGMWKPGVIETMRSDSVAVVRQVYNLTLWAYDLLPEQQQGPSCASREPPCQPGEWVWVETGGKGFWGRFLFYGEVVSDHNFSEVATVHVDQRISRTSKHIRKEALLACSLPKCEDTDVGATDAVTASCSTIMQDDTKCFAEIDEDHSNHNVFGDFWPAGFEDDDDFQLMEMCCMCGGGSFDLSLTGISHLPVNLSEGDFMEAKVWRKCTQRAGSVEGRKTCNQQHTFISKAVYEAQLAPFLRYCLLPDPDLCDNLQAQGRLPAWNTTVEHFIPLFFRELGLSSLDQIDSKDICRKSITTVCPAIFPLKFGHFQYQREGQCGEKSTTVLQSGKTVSYESSEVYSDPSFGLMTFKFRLFLLLITFLWGLASIEEFRLIIVWWNVLLTLPTLTAGKPCTASMLGEDEGAFEVIGLHRRTRILAVTLNLLPRTVLQFLIFLVGIEYLLSVRSVSDLIMSLLSHLEQSIFCNLPSTCRCHKHYQILRRRKPIPEDLRKMSSTVYELM